jgi:hypothetical protein
MDYACQVSSKASSWASVALPDSSRKMTVVAVGVEGRVEGDQVDGGIGQVATQDVEVVAVVEDVGGEVGHSASAAP